MTTDADPISRATAPHYAWGDGCDGWHLVQTDALSVIEERMPSGTAEVRHRHHRARQFFRVLEGALTVEVEGAEHTLGPGEGIEVAPGRAHEVRNGGPAEAAFLVVSAPPSHGDREPAPSIGVRRSHAADAPAVADLLAAAFAEFRSLYTAEAYAATTPSAEVIRARLIEGPTWVAEVDSRVVGTVAATPDGSSLYVRSMACTPGVRGRGVGLALLREVEEHARERGVERLTLATTPFLTAAIRLYERYGFVEDAQAPADLHGTPLIAMSKPLSPQPPRIVQPETDAEICQTWHVMAQLRPHLTAEAYVTRVRRLMEHEGYRLAAVVEDGGVRAVAGYRVMETLYCERLLCVDDLVTDERARSGGHGKRLLDWLKEEGRRLGCAELHLDSRLHREGSHRFYYREGLPVAAFHFVTAL